MAAPTKPLVEELTELADQLRAAADRVIVAAEKVEAAGLEDEEENRTDGRD